MGYVENIVVGEPLCEPMLMFAVDEADWYGVELDKTFFTNERFLPAILVELGIVKSNSEVKKNKPELFKILKDTDFFEFKWGKRRFWVQVGGVAND